MLWQWLEEKRVEELGDYCNNPGENDEAQTREIVTKYSEKWWDCEYILNSEQIELTNRFDVEYEEKRGIKGNTKIFYMNN